MQSANAMTAQKKAIIWEQWEKGSPMIQIAKSIRKPPATVFSYLRYHGGIRPRQRVRSSTQLSLEEREEISRGLAGNLSIRAIALLLDRSPSTICREIKRNGGDARYRATSADQAAWRRGKRPKPCVLKTNATLRELVVEKLSSNWSPEQISAWLLLTYPEDETLRVSHAVVVKLDVAFFMLKQPDLWAGCLSPDSATPRRSVTSSWCRHSSAADDARGLGCRSRADAPGWSRPVRCVARSA